MHSHPPEHPKFKGKLSATDSAAVAVGFQAGIGPCPVSGHVVPHWGNPEQRCLLCGASAAASVLVADNEHPAERKQGGAFSRRVSVMTASANPSVFDQQQFSAAVWAEVTDLAEMFLDDHGYPHNRKLAQGLAFGQWLFTTGRLASSFGSSLVKWS